MHTKPYKYTELKLLNLKIVLTKSLFPFSLFRHEEVCIVQTTWHINFVGVVSHPYNFESIKAWEINKRFWTVLSISWQKKWSLKFVSTHWLLKSFSSQTMSSFRHLSTDAIDYFICLHSAFRNLNAKNKLICPTASLGYKCGVNDLWSQ